MSKKIGIQLGADGDLNVVNGQLTISDTLYQNQYIILKAQKGELKELPLWGAGIDGIVNDTDMLAWKKLIREELQRDGLKVNSLSIAQGEITLKADYQ